MKIAVFGTGIVGRTVAGRLAELGHDVTVGTRDPAATLARTQPGSAGTPPFATWATAHEVVHVATFSDAAAGAELVVNATSGSVSIAALRAAGTASLTGKVIMDIANPLDFTHGMPPALFVKDTDSLGEQIQREFPEAKVVKALNTMNSALMAHPRQLAGGDHSAFVCGNDAGAKKTVVALLESFGHTDVIDLGDISASRGTEMLLPVWLRLMQTLGTPNFNFKIVR